jgi:hypothetical protein
LDASTKEIFLLAFDDKKIDIPSAGQWKIFKITPEIPLGLFEQYDEKYALAMCG